MHAQIQLQNLPAAPHRYFGDILGSRAKRGIWKPYLSTTPQHHQNKTVRDSFFGSPGGACSNNPLGFRFGARRGRAAAAREKQFSAPPPCRGGPREAVFWAAAVPRRPARSSFLDRGRAAAAREKQFCGPPPCRGGPRESFLRRRRAAAAREKQFSAPPPCRGDPREAVFCAAPPRACHGGPREAVFWAAAVPRRPARSSFLGRGCAAAARET